MSTSLNIDGKEVRQIPGYEGLYSVSQEGGIWSHAKPSGVSPHAGMWLAICIDLSGYAIVPLSKNGTRKTFRVHRAVALAWLSKDDEKATEVNHKNGIKSDPRCSNLEWVSRSKNVLHAYRVGLNKGARKLTNEHIFQIRSYVNKGGLGKDAAAMFGVSKATISRIVNGMNVLGPQIGEERTAGVVPGTEPAAVH